MNSGPVVAMAWEGQGAVKTGRFGCAWNDCTFTHFFQGDAWRNQPCCQQAWNNQGRLLYTGSGNCCFWRHICHAFPQVGRNICHGSDAVESAEHEIGLWFRWCKAFVSALNIDLLTWQPSGMRTSVTGLQPRRIGSLGTTRTVGADTRP